MTEDWGGGYLAGLPDADHAALARVNGPGLAALRRYLDTGAAVAFLGARASLPLYPPMAVLIGELIDAAASKLTPGQQASCRAAAEETPEAAVEIVRNILGPGTYREVLRDVLRVQTEAETGRSWTPVQELVCRCPFKAVVTTNYDPGIVNARMRVRPGVSATGFTTWEDELGLDRWRTGDAFGAAELPVLFAHGQHNRPDSVVLATTEYRRAYAGKLPHVLARLMDSGHLVWIGFNFTEQRIGAVLREIADRTGTRVDPGGAPRHVAVMAWDPGRPGNDPGILAQRAEIEYGAQVVLYPARGEDHSALARLLSAFTAPDIPAVTELPARPVPPRVPGGAAAGANAGPGLPAGWFPAAEPVPHFTGRAEELARLDRWAGDPQVAVTGVTAWGGAGKTALVTHWVNEAGGPGRRPAIQGVFGWSFYADPSAENWAKALLGWARRDLSIQVAGTGRLAEAVLALIRDVPLLLVLDGLEVLQEGPAAEGFGRLLDGTLREVLAGACYLRPGGLILLTSRFPFADLETLDGGPVRMLEVPPFTPAEGSALLATAGADWLAEEDRRALVRAVDGHALAVGVLAGLLAARLPAADLAELSDQLASAARTHARVSRVLDFYAGRLAEADRYLLAAVSLFARPVDATAVLALAGHESFGARLAGWTPAMVRAAVRGRLGGLASWHPDGTISAHPLVRDTFRRLVMAAAPAAAETALTGLPAGRVDTRAGALRVVEAIELLLEARQWEPGDNLFQTRCARGDVFRHLPAARLGQRAASAFVATPARREACVAGIGLAALGFYLNEVGLHAMYAGDLAVAREFLTMAGRHYRDNPHPRNLAIDLQNLSLCLAHLGQTGPAADAAAEALSCAENSGEPLLVRHSLACLGWVADLVGDTTAAEEQFTAANQVEVADDPGELHLYALTGSMWADWLARTGRSGPAQTLAGVNLEICRRNGWNVDVARCERLLGRFALAAGDAGAAGGHLAAAAEVLRDGDCLTELAITLTDMAGHAQARGDEAEAERNVAEAIAIASPRGLAPAHSAALAARARIRAGQAATARAAAQDHLAQGRDAADAALRMATWHQLAWHELDAMRAHAALDLAEGGGDWAAQADALRARLVLPGLNPSPLQRAGDTGRSRRERRADRPGRK